MRKIAVGIVGFGNMGAAIGLALKSNKRYTLCAFEKDQKKQKGFNFSNNIWKVIKGSDVVILAIKPQDIGKFLNETKLYFLDKKPLIITIAAGLTTSYFETQLPKARVVRVMPNLAARINESVSFICKGKYAKQNDINCAKDIFSSIGEVFVTKEGMMDGVTAVSGSGPGFLYFYMDAMYRGAKNLGFNDNDARAVVAQTVYGAAKLALLSDKSFETLVSEVASPGGTTHAGLDVLTQEKLPQIAKKTLLAAKDRARQLSEMLTQK
jgi:pyrroline-5-carboxylate reductase